MRSLILSLVLLAAACSTAPVGVPGSASPAATSTASAVRTAAPTATPVTPAPVAAGGIEIFRTGQLHGTYVWVVAEESAPQDRVTETVYAVPADGSRAQLVLRRLRPRGIPLFGGQTSGGIVLSRQLSLAGTKLALEWPTLGPAMADGFAVADLAEGRIGQIARGDAQTDLLPAWSPDGSRIAFARRKTTPGAPDDGVWVINADGTGLRQVVEGSCCAQQTMIYGWTADGAGIAFAKTFEGANYSIADAASGAVSGPHGQAFGLAPASWRSTVPQFAAAFSQGDKGGEQRIDIAAGIGTVPVTVWHEASDLAAGIPLLLNARWSPLADEILFLHFARESRIARVAVGGGPPTDIASVGNPTRAEWLPDGRIVYLSVTPGAGGAAHTTDGRTDTTIFSVPAGIILTDLAVRTYP